MSEKYETQGIEQRGALMSVRSVIRERVRTGQLPTGPHDKTFAGKGSNTACACCGRNIAGHDIECEVHFKSSLYAFRAHLDCYRIWWEEWTAEDIKRLFESRSATPAATPDRRESLVDRLNPL
jgi:hypothetical protein